MRLSPYFFSACLAAAATLSAETYTLTPDHANGIYARHETVGWTLTLAPDTATPADGFAYTLKKNNAVLIKSGKAAVVNGRARFECAADEPEMVFLEIAPVDPKDKPHAAGAAVEPTKIKPVEARPKDFDEFWQKKIALLQTKPVNAVVTPGESGKEGVTYETVRLDNYDGSHVYAQLAKPSRSGKFPAMLIMQWAGVYPMQKAWAVDRAAEGWLVLDVFAHDFPGNMPKEFYDALPKMIQSYNTIYDDERDRNYFLRMYLGDYRAADYLASRSEWDGKIFVANGTSMGGQQSFALSGLHPKVTHMVILVPAGADSHAVLHGRHEGYPNWNSNNPKVMETASYFDSINFASNIHATSLVSMGFIDNVCPPTGIWTAFNLIPGRKEAVPLVYAAHNHQSTPEQLKPFTDRSKEWFAKLVKGEEPDVR
jgi:cephalosporin-C deacetylase-like acetyl esterase